MKLWTPADFKKGDRVKVNGSWGIVARVNPKTLSVDTGHMPWPIKYRYTEVSEHAPSEPVAEDDRADDQDGEPGQQLALGG